MAARFPCSLSVRLAASTVRLSRLAAALAALAAAVATALAASRRPHDCVCVQEKWEAGRASVGGDGDVGLVESIATSPATTPPQPPSFVREKSRHRVDRARALGSRGRR